MLKLRWAFLAYISLLLPIIGFDLDRRLAMTWFDMQGHVWSFKHHWFVEGWLHDGGHHLVVSLYLLILACYVWSLFGFGIRRYRYGLSYLVISLPAATLSVSLFKQLTRVDCPWSIVDFGGKRDYQFWLQSLWSPLSGADHCFPAGHASSAYMFFGLYFFCRYFWPKAARTVLFIVIFSGLIFGFSQQLRGAHFISHDLTSALICWSVTLMLWRYWAHRYLPYPEQQPAILATVGS